MKSKSFVKFLVLAGVLCLVMGMASVAMAFTISGVNASCGTDGTVTMSVTLAGYVSGDQLTIKVMEYGSTDASYIKYIDQVTVSGGTVNIPNFKLKDATTATQKVYKLSVGGTGVSTAYAETLFKLAEADTFQPNKAWIVAEPKISANVYSNIKLVVADSNGHIGIPPSAWTIAWSCINKPQGSIETFSNLTIINPNFKGDVAGSYTLRATLTKPGSTITTGDFVVNVTSDPLVILPDNDFVDDVSKAKIGGPIKRRSSGYYVVREPVAVSNDSGNNITADVLIPTNTAGANVTYEVKSATNNVVADLTSIAPGKYKMIITTTSTELKAEPTTKVVYFSVMKTDTVSSSIHTRSSLSDISISRVNKTLTLSVGSKTGNTYTWWLLDTNTDISKNVTYTDTNADKARWVKLGSGTSDSIDIAVPPVGTYRISVYTKSSESTADYIDAYRIVTIKVNSDGTVQKAVNINGDAMIDEWGTGF